MNSVFDIASWFLAQNEMTHKKLQKLCYYAQAWSYAICPKPISDAEFEAWIHGPVCKELYQRYKHYKFNYIPKEKNAPNLKHDENLFLCDVWETYGDMSANSLEALSHSEPPWQKARIGIPSDQPCHIKINPIDMKEYYQSIYIGGDA